MAQVIVEFGFCMASQPNRISEAPVFTPNPSIEEMASSSSSQQTTMTATAFNIASIYSDGDIWVAFGNNPTASIGSGVFIAANERRDFGPLGEGDKAAVIDDS